MKKKILLVEDEKDIVELLQLHLNKEGFEVAISRDGESALQMIKKQKFDLILLDLMIPRIDGMDLCRQIKMDPNLKEIPIVMVTAKSEETDVVVGLEMGAEDYITKPFSYKILMTRIKKILRQNKGLPKPETTDVIEYGQLKLDLKSHEAFLDEQLIALTKYEYDLIKFLITSPGWVFSRYQLIEAIKGYDHDVTDRSIDVLMVNIRRKMKNFGKNIETVRGVGYRLKKRSI